MKILAMEDGAKLQALEVVRSFDVGLFFGGSAVGYLFLFMAMGVFFLCVCCLCFPQQLKAMRSIGPDRLHRGDLGQLSGRVAVAEGSRGCGAVADVTCFVVCFCFVFVFFLGGARRIANHMLNSSISD